MWKSTKFLTLLIDVVVSLILYFVGKYAAPSIFADVQVVIAALTALVLAFIAGPEVGAWLNDKAELRELDKEQMKASVAYDYQIMECKAGFLPIEKGEGEL